MGSNGKIVPFNRNIDAIAHVIIYYLTIYDLLFGYLPFTI